MLHITPQFSNQIYTQAPSNHHPFPPQILLHALKALSIRYMYLRHCDSVLLQLSLQLCRIKLTIAALCFNYFACSSTVKFFHVKEGSSHALSDYALLAV